MPVRCVDVGAGRQPNAPMSRALPHPLGAKEGEEDANRWLWRNTDKGKGWGCWAIVHCSSPLLPSPLPHWLLFLPAFHQIGGYHNLEEAYLAATPSKIVPNTTCHLPRQDAMHLFRDPITGDLPWTGMTLGLTVLATWYWCTDQVIAKQPIPRSIGHSGVSTSLTGPWAGWSQRASVWTPIGMPCPSSALTGRA